MIFYFSATGNCKYVAQRIAKELNDTAISITDCIKKNMFEFEISQGEKVGIVSPTYALKLPLITEEFFEKFRISAKCNPYVFFVATYGTTPGQTGYYAKKLLAESGITLNGAYSVKMPDNWTPTYDLSDLKKVAKINKSAEKRIEKVIAKIIAKKKGNFQFPKTPHFTDKIAVKEYEQMRRTSHFIVEKSCIGCGLCAKKCPANAIEIKDKKPIWTKDKCYMCLGCLHRCPEFSIQYEDRTKNHGQYLNPNVRV